MKLYQGNLSPFASRVRLAIYAKGLDGNSIEILAPPGGTASAEFKAINPAGKIPVLDTGKRMLPESEVICEYLDDMFPAVPLRPTDAAGCAQVRLLSRFVDLYLYPTMSPLFGQIDPSQRDQAVVTQGLAKVDETLALLERWLTDGGYAVGAYSVGNSLTLADCALVPGLLFVSVLLPMLGRADAFAGVPNVANYWRQVRAVPVCARVSAEMQEALQAFMAG